MLRQNEKNAACVWTSRPLSRRYANRVNGGLMRRSLLRAGTVLILATSALVATNAPANAEPGCGVGSYVSNGTYFLTYNNCLQNSAVWKVGNIFAGSGGSYGSCLSIGPLKQRILASYNPSWAVTSTNTHNC